MIARALGLAVTLMFVAGCTSPAKDEPEPKTPSSEATPPPPAEPLQARPKVGECHRLSPAAAVAPTNASPAVACGKPHTAETFAVGRLEMGGNLAVDSPAVQAQPARICPRRAAEHLKITPVALRLTMARSVWFTPTVEDADVGARWFRCDLVVVAAPDALMRLPGPMVGKGALPAIAMCATAEPSTKAFNRVACVRKHSWVAVASVDLPGKALPTPAAASARMESVCRAAALARADDPLDLRWSEERPTAEQWDAGQRHGICWVPG